MPHELLRLGSATKFPPPRSYLHAPKISPIAPKLPPMVRVCFLLHATAEARPFLPFPQRKRRGRQVVRSV